MSHVGVVALAVIGADVGAARLSNARWSPAGVRLRGRRAPPRGTARFLRPSGGSARLARKARIAAAVTRHPRSAFREAPGRRPPAPLARTPSLVVVERPGWRARGRRGDELSTSRSLHVSTQPSSCRSGAGIRAVDFPVTTRGPLRSPERARDRSVARASRSLRRFAPRGDVVRRAERRPSSMANCGAICDTDLRVIASGAKRSRRRHATTGECRDLECRATASLSSDSGDHSGPRVVTGKSTERIPAPERHDGRSVTRREESARYSASVTTATPELAQQVARRPLMKAGAQRGRRGAAQGLPAGRLRGTLGNSGCVARPAGKASAPARSSQKASRAPGRRPSGHASTRRPGGHRRSRTASADTTNHLQPRAVPTASR